MLRFSNLASLLSVGWLIHVAGAAVLPQVAFKVSIAPLGDPARF